MNNFIQNYIPEADALLVMSRAFLFHANSLELLQSAETGSVDAIVTDPPYELGFMGAAWDKSGIAYSVAFWRECLRVLKPGGHLLAFGGSRTFHRMVCAIEDAGFEVRDMLEWLYGSGFPKSRDISKAIDEESRRDYILAALELGMNIPGNNLHDWTKGGHVPGNKWWQQFKSVLPQEQWGAIERKVTGKAYRVRHKSNVQIAPTSDGEYEVTAPATDTAREWVGYGTALKPAHEPICLARKPLAEQTVTANCLRYGTGAVSVDACRIASGAEYTENRVHQTGDHFSVGSGINVCDTTFEPNAEGRWPANVLLGCCDENRACDDCPLKVLDAQSGHLKSGKPGNSKRNAAASTFNGGGGVPLTGYGDEGGASRFFYCAKPSKAEKNRGCDNLPVKANRVNAPRESEAANFAASQGNSHKTVKPVALMQYLVRLVTRPGALVLDPFMGSGTTGCACIAEGRAFVGIDLEAEHVAIARARVSQAVRDRQEAEEEAARAAREAALQTLSMNF